MSKSRIAIGISTVYILLAVLSFVIMIIARDSTPMSGIFLVLLTQPWPAIITKFIGTRLGDSAIVNGLFLLIGGMINGLLIYLLLNLLIRMIKRD